MESSSPNGSRFNLSRRTITIISAVVGVLVLAGVMFGVSALSTPGDADSGEVVELPSSRSQSLLDEAIVKLGQGDEDGAADLLREALELDPDNEQAAAELSRLERSQAAVDEPQGSSGSNTNANAGGETDDPQPPAPADPAVWDKEYSLPTLLPKTIDGYEVGVAVAQGPDAQVPADPTPSGPAMVRRALFSVHDKGSSADAATFISNVTKSAFPQNSADVKVNGVSGYFGTDGDLFASVAFARGRYVFEVILTADEVPPGALVDVAVKAASAFPTAP